MFDRKKFVIVLDCNGLMHMVKHGVKRDLKYGGYSTSIIFGFINQMRYYSARFATDRFVFVWDAFKSLRRDRHPWYKQKPSRNLTPIEREFEESAIRQFHQLRRYVVPAIKFNNSFYAPGYEADDLIANVVMGNPDFDFILVSRDADMYQLLRYCHIVNPATKALFTLQDLWEKYGVTPEQWVEVKAIGGCNSDEIKGVPGVAEHTAILWINRRLKRNSKRYAAIKSDLSSENSVIKRNDWLVRLPLPGTPACPVDFSNEILSAYGFEDVCSRFGFSSFLEDTYYNEMVGLFNLKEE